MDKNRLETLINGYREQAKPLMDDLNVRLGGKYPDNCLNEIRAMLDHVSRCYRVEGSNLKPDEADNICNEELSKADWRRESSETLENSGSLGQRGEPLRLDINPLQGCIISVLDIPRDKSLD